LKLAVFAMFVNLGQTIPLGLVHHEAGIDHPEWIEYSFLEEVIKPLATHDLDHPRQNVHRKPIFIHGSRLSFQR